MLPCSSPVIQVQYWVEQRPVHAELVVQGAHRALAAARLPRIAPPGIAGQHLAGEEHDHAEEPQRDQRQPEALQEVRRHVTPSRLARYPHVPVP